MQGEFGWTAPAPQPMSFMTVAPWPEPSFKAPLSSLEDPVSMVEPGPGPTSFNANVEGLFASENLMFNDIPGAGWEDCHQVGGSTTDILALEEPTVLPLPLVGHMPLLVGPGKMIAGPVPSQIDVASLVVPPPAPSGSGGSGHATEEGFHLAAPPAAGQARSPEQPLCLAQRRSLSEEDEEGEEQSDVEEVGNKKRMGSLMHPHVSPLSSSRSIGERASNGAIASVAYTQPVAPSPAALRKRPAATRDAAPRSVKRTASTVKPTTLRRIGKPRRRPAPRRGPVTDYSSDDEDASLSLGAAGRRIITASEDSGPARTSRRLQARGPLPFQSRLSMDSDFITFGDADADGDGEEPPSPRRGPSPARTSRRTGAGTGSGIPAPVAAVLRKAPTSRAGKRTVPLAAQRIRATSARHELKGRPSFAEIVEAGFMRPGPHRFAVGNVEVAASVCDDGAIVYAGDRYRAISKFALIVLRERNPTRQSCDGWKEVAWNGEKLDALRVRVQQHARQQARMRTQ